MSTTDLSAVPITHVATGRLLTIADVEELPTRLPSGDVDYELNDGRLVIVSPPGRQHSKVQTRISVLLARAEDDGLGEAFTEVGIVLWRSPDRLVGADAAFVTSGRRPVRETKEGYLETIPDLVVEIRSKDDTVAELKDKAADYLKAGVQVVWLVDPINRNATVYEGTATQTRLDENAILSKADLLGQHRAARRSFQGLSDYGSGGTFCLLGAGSQRVDRFCVQRTNIRVAATSPRRAWSENGLCTSKRSSNSLEQKLTEKTEGKGSLGSGLGSLKADCRPIRAMQSFFLVYQHRGV